MIMLKILITLSLFTLNVFAENKFINNYVFEWCDKDPQSIEKYLKNSINGDKRNANAAYALGSLYLNGIGLKQDIKKADLYITIAANLNLPEAINSIGDGYYSGDIRHKNIKMALEYYEKAAKMGFGPAQFNAGVVLMNSAKSKKDLEKAIFYLDKASKNRDDLNSMTESAKKYKLHAKDKLKRFNKN